MRKTHILHPDKIQRTFFVYHFFFFIFTIAWKIKKDTIIQPFLPAALPVLVWVSIPPEQIDTRRRTRRPGDYFSHCREAVQPKKMMLVKISQVGFQRLIPVFTFVAVQRSCWQRSRGAQRWPPPINVSWPTRWLFETLFKECHILVCVSLTAIAAAEGEIVFLVQNWMFHLFPDVGLENWSRQNFGHLF